MTGAKARDPRHRQLMCRPRADWSWDAEPDSLVADKAVGKPVADIAAEAVAGVVFAVAAAVVGAERPGPQQPAC